MTTNIIRIFNCETQETIDREMTAEEWANCQSVEAQSKAKALAQSQAEAERKALLERLGITADEAKLLIG